MKFQSDQVLRLKPEAFWMHRTIFPQRCTLLHWPLPKGHVITSYSIHYTKLYDNFELEYDFVGSILSIKKREAPKVKPVIAAPYKVDVAYNAANQFLSMNLKNDTLHKVVEEITRLTGKNFVIDPEIRGNVVNAYLLNRPVDEVLDMFAKSNAIKLSSEGRNNFV